MLVGAVPSVRYLCLILQRRQWLILPAFTCLNSRILAGFGLIASIYLINSHQKPTVCMELWRKESELVCEWVGGSGIKNLPASPPSWSLGQGRLPGGGNVNPLQHSCLENPMDRGAWWTTVHGVTKSQAWLNDWALTHTFKLLNCTKQFIVKQKE